MRIWSLVSPNSSERRGTERNIRTILVDGTVDRIRRARVPANIYQRLRRPVYVLSEDADDEADILPYVQREELTIITADVKNFAPLDESRHEGLLLLNDQRASAYSVANAVLDIIEQYRTPENMTRNVEIIDSWL